MSTTAFRCRWMPSRCTTSCVGRSNGTGGYRLHISVLARLRLLAGMRRSAWLSLENSQSRPARRSPAARFYDLVADAPQAMSLHRHLVLPALVEPFFFIIPWHLRHSGVLIPPIWHIPTARTPCAVTGPRRFRTHILDGLESGDMRIRNRDTPSRTTHHTRFRTHILANNPETVARQGQVGPADCDREPVERRDCHCDGYGVCVCREGGYGHDYRDRGRQERPDCCDCDGSV